MTVGSLLEMLEKGETVKTPVNSSLITILQATIDRDYDKATIDFDIKDGTMTLTPLCKFVKREKCEDDW